MSKKSNATYDFSLFEPTKKEDNNNSASDKNKKNIGVCPCLGHTPVCYILIVIFNITI